MAFGASVSQYMESGDEYTYAYSLLTPWSRMHSFEGEREGGREGDNSRTMQRAEEGRKVRAMRKR